MENGRQRHVLHVFPTFEVGGSQRRLARLVETFGCDFGHSIIALDNNWEAMEILPPEAKISQVRVSNKQQSTFKTLITAIQVLNEQKPDVLVTYNWGSIEWAAANLLLGYSHVHIEDGFRPDEILKRKARRNVFRRLALGRNCKVVVVSETLKRIALKEWRLPASRITLVPNGVDVESFSNTRSPVLKSEYGLSDENLVIGTVAALRPEKNLKALIRAFSSLNTNLNAVLVIVGDGVERRLLQDTVERLKITDKVVFVGQTDSPEHYFAAFDIFALSSATEQMPLSLLEAMSAKLPIASYNVGDVAAMVDSSNLEYVVNCDEASLSKALEKLGQKPSERHEIGLANFEKAKRVFSESKMVENYRNLFS